MEYYEYMHVRDLVWKILLKYPIASLPVNIVKLCKRLDIAVKYFDDDKREDGEAQIIGDDPIIFIRRTLSVERKRFTIAHELGHILLGHVGKYTLVNREPAPTDNPIEQQANVFASRLLAPACVLHEMRSFSAEEIIPLCGISRQSAIFRLKRLMLLEQRESYFMNRYGHGCFYIIPLEVQVRIQFDDFIRKAQKKKGIKRPK